MGLFFHKKKAVKHDGLSVRLSKTKNGLLGRLAQLALGRGTADDDVLAGIEEALLAADVGVDTTFAIVEGIERRAKGMHGIDAAMLQSMLRNEILSLLDKPVVQPPQPAAAKPYVIMVVGVNGSGKTSSIGKLAYQYHKQGKKVYIAAADTFRAAAAEQLEAWAERGNTIVFKSKTGGDPAAVAYQAVSAGIAHGADMVLVDTAGRLHNKINLMKELTKIRNSIGKAMDGAPHETMLVLDGSTGQNAYKQAQEFHRACEVSSLIVTKLDGSAKGGVVIGICREMNIPIKYIGVGEGTDDLRPFSSHEFVEALLG
jgi:fused signal recognition particle receptor